MANRSDERKMLRCSFCNKTQDQVRKLIAGPGAYICDECIEICTEIIEEELGDTELEDVNLLKPKEIKSFLDEYVIGQEEAKKYWRLPCTTIIRESLHRKILMLSCRRVIFLWLDQQVQVRHILPKPLPNF